jgi:hypothetical protein
VLSRKRQQTGAAMPHHDERPEDRWQFRLNVIGFTLVAILLTWFCVFYGSDLLSFLELLFSPRQSPYQ